MTSIEKTDPDLHELLSTVDATAESPETQPTEENKALKSTFSSNDLEGENVAIRDSPSVAPNATGHSGTTPESRLGTFVGKYRITEILGQGGMGVVYAARDQIIGRDVAVKFLSGSAADSDTALQRFVQEARAAGQLQHPNVVSLFDVDQMEGTWYLVMEMVGGGTASDLIDSGDPLPWEEATRIIADACRGLKAAHAKGMIHRDIKPDNIMIADDGTAKISDFGLAKMQDRRMASLTQQNQVLGTPHYMSPEQCRSSRVDERTDLYSLGATYYDLLTGNPPFSCSTDMMQVMYAQCHEPTPDPGQLADDLPPECRLIIERAMAKSPDDRYSSADEMLDDLDALLLEPTKTETVTSGFRTSKLPSLAKSYAAAMRLQPPPKKRFGNPLIWTVAGVLTALVVAVPFLLRNENNGSDEVPQKTAAIGAAPPAFPVPPFSAPPFSAPTFPLPEAAIAEGPPIKIGVLHSLSGTMAVSESGVVDAVLLAVEELNQRGGVLGRPVETVIADGWSDDQVFTREAERLITEDNVVTLFGCWTSSSRKRVKSVVEKHNHLLIYPVQYEGLEQSPNIIYTGAAPNQQIIPAVKWAFAFLDKRRFYLVGSDYVFPRAASAIIKDSLSAMGIEAVGESFVPLGHTGFKEVAAAIVESRADVILNMINRQSNVAFFHELRLAGIKPAAVPTISFSIAEPELRGLNTKEMVGDYAAWNYFQSVDTPPNLAFVKRFHTRYSPTRMISDPMETAYFSVKLWAQAVEAAGNTDPTAIRSAMVVQSLVAPEGNVRIDATTGHTWKKARIGTVSAEADFDIVWSSQKPIAPQPFPASRSRDEWEQFLGKLYSNWGGRWAAPAK